MSAAIQKVHAGSGVMLLGVLFAVVCGIATALEGATGGGLIVGLLVGLGTLIVPVRWLVVMLFVASFLVTGQLIYFGQVDRALWLPFLFGLVLLVRYPLDLMRRGSDPEHEDEFLPRVPRALLLWIILYFATIVASSLFNLAPPLQLIVSMKEYVFLWAVFFVIAAGLIQRRLLVRIWMLLPWLMPLQLPLVVYQRLVIAPSRLKAGEAWDAVVGAFGGDPMGGGSSGAMGLFCVVMMSSVWVCWRARLMSGSHAAVLISSGVLSIALAEIKFAVLLLPVAFVVLLAADSGRKLAKGVIGLVAISTLALTLLWSYNSQYDRNAGGQSTVAYIQTMFTHSTDPEFVDLKTREMGRYAAIKFWMDRHGAADPARLLIGHGAGASRTGDVVIGEAAKGFPFIIARSTLAILLWETGLVGTLAFVAVLVLASMQLVRHARDIRLDVETRAVAASMAVAVVVLAAGLSYNTDLLFGHQTQLILMLCLGHVALLNGASSSRARLR